MAVTLSLISGTMLDMAHRLAPMSLSDELVAALDARAERERRTRAGMVRVILEDALLSTPPPEPAPPLLEADRQTERSAAQKRATRAPSVRGTEKTPRVSDLHIWDPKPNG